MDPREAEVRRLLDRYIVEIVETYDLCPWAKPARTGGELAVEILWGQPAEDAWFHAATRLLARPETRVAMVVAPELRAAPAELRALRDRIAARIPTAGVADFHPDAPLELASPAKLVPFLRRSPDPLLQLVPLALLQAVRSAPPPPDLAAQARMLHGEAASRESTVDRLARENHARIAAARDAVIAKLAEIAADRAQSYARVGINVSRTP